MNLMLQLMLKEYINRMSREFLQGVMKNCSSFFFFKEITFPPSPVQIVLANISDTPTQYNV